MNNSLFKFVHANAEAVSGSMWLLMDFCWLRGHILIGSVFALLALAAGAIYMGMMVVLDVEFEKTRFSLGLAAILWLMMNTCWMWTLESLGSFFGVLSMFVLGWTFLSSPFAAKHFGRFLR